MSSAINNSWEIGEINEQQTTDGKLQVVWIEQGVFFLLYIVDRIEEMVNFNLVLIFVVVLR